MNDDKTDSKSDKLVPEEQIPSKKDPDRGSPSASACKEETRASKQSTDIEQQDSGDDGKGPDS